jgi:hypothetical protein
MKGMYHIMPRARICPYLSVHTQIRDIDLKKNWEP